MAHILFYTGALYCLCPALPFVSSPTLQNLRLRNITAASGYFLWTLKAHIYEKWSNMCLYLPMFYKTPLRQIFITISHILAKFCTTFFYFTLMMNVFTYQLINCERKEKNSVYNKSICNKQALKKVPQEMWEVFKAFMRENKYEV